MKAIVQNGYGSPDVLTLKEIAKPTVNEDNVLVRVHAAAINAGDIFMMRGIPWMVRLSVGFPKPRNHVPGWDLAGIVEAVGKKVTRFQLGDEVFSSHKRAFAEYACVPEGNLIRKPASLTFEQAAAAGTAAFTALIELRDGGKVQPGQKVLINGASGGVGTFAVQIAKWLGAEVTGVCSTRNVELVRSIGAAHVIDYTSEDFTRGDQRYDLILDNVGNHSFASLRRVLTPTGAIQPNTGHAGMGYVIKAFALSLFLRKQNGMLVAVSKYEDMITLKELLESKQVTPVIDRTYPLNEAVAAFAYVNEGHAQGRVVISMEVDSR